MPAQLAGVVDFVGAPDVPGKNEVFDAALFAEGRVVYHSQPLGLIVPTPPARPPAPLSWSRCSAPRLILGYR